MIAYIQGRLMDRGSETCIILTKGGVGYSLYLPGHVLERLPTSGQEVEFFVRTIVKEDAIELYGFSCKEEQETFSLLLGASKLGPKTALAILSIFSPCELADLIIQEDIRSLTRVPGIGSKSAKRIIWELKEKFAQSSWSQKDLHSLPRQEKGVFSDALAGLIHLGYAESEIRPVLNRLLKEEPDLVVEEAIRGVLKQMATTKQ